MSFPRYERYKDSGVEWLGEVPEHWPIRRMKTLFEIKKRIAGELGYDILSITQNGIKIKDTESNEGQLAMDYAKYQLVYPGDFAMNHMDLLTGYVDISNVAGVTSPDYRVFSIRNPALCHPRYFLRLFQNAYHQKIFYAFGQGSSQLGRWRLPTEAFNEFSLPCPSFPEQELICHFLDRETGKIDELIEKQRQLIELLKEKRQAVILHATTKGLDPAAPMKDSGVAGIGFIPSHWSTGPLKRFAQVIDCKHVTVDFVDIGKPIVSIRELKNDRIELSEAKLASEEDWDFLRDDRIPVPGDLIICRNASVGAVGEVMPGMEFCIGQDVCLVRPSTPNGFAFYIFISTSVRKQIDALMVGATIRRLNVEAIRNLAVTQPPTKESFTISSHLRLESLKFDSLILEAAHTIDILQERRSSLISAAVTGKIEVRAYMAKPAMSVTQYTSGFAHQLLAAEILDRCNSQRMGRIKLQKLIHLCEYHGQVSEVQGDYSRKAAGPFDARAMAGISRNLKKQKWFEEVKEGERYVYRPLEKRGEHKKYLAHWQAEMPRIDEVLNLLGTFKTRECEIVSTLYAAWNDLLIDGGSADDAAILHEASSAERWHKSKEQIAPERWKKALQWMKAAKSALTTCCARR